MTQNDSNSGQLKPLLEQQKTDLSNLLNLLNEEHKVVNQRDAIQLQMIAEHKQNLVLQLDHSEAMLRIKLSGQGLSLNNEGMQQLLDSSPEGEREELQQLWQQVTDFADQCKKQNQVNGRIIMASQASLHQAQGILQGTLESSVYTRQGKTEYSGNNKKSSFTKA